MASPTAARRSRPRSTPLARPRDRDDATRRARRKQRRDARGGSRGVAGRLLSQREHPRRLVVREVVAIAVVRAAQRGERAQLQGDGGGGARQLGRLPPAPRAGAHGVRRQQLRRGGGGGGRGGAETVRGRRRRHAGDGVSLPRVQRQLWRAAAALPCAREGGGRAAAAQSPPLQHARACHRRRRVRGAAKPARDAGDGGGVAADRAGVRCEPAVAQLRRRRLRVPAADGGGELSCAARRCGRRRPPPSTTTLWRKRSAPPTPPRSEGRASAKGKIVFYWSQMRPCVMAPSGGSATRTRRRCGRSGTSARRRASTATSPIAQPAPRAAADRDEALQDAPARRFLHLQRPTAAHDGRRRDVPFILGRVGRPDRLWPRIGRRLDQPLSVPEPRALGGEEGARPHQHEPQAEGVAAAVLQRVEDAAGALALQLRIGAVASAPLRDCLARQFSLLPGSPAAEEARLARPPPSAKRSSTTGGRGGGSRWGGSAVSTSISSLAGCAACSSCTLAAPPARASLIGSRGRSASASTRTPRINGNWGPDARIPGHQHIANSGAAGGVTPRHSCEYAEAEIRRPGGASVFGHETPALAPLRCATAAIWLVLRQPVERLLSRLYKPREKRCAHGPAAYRRRYCGESVLPHRPICSAPSRRTSPARIR